ncbi:hypothetical protein F5Y13DRAFT_202991 [Hypoxylon sp. FL1857]|nr:hypothetical protein F5Y13DRAFT_202991 [Hypoxylon sp. FL1857]
MPSAQPTCAARVIRSKLFQNGWGATLTKETNDMVSRVKQDAEAVYQLQLNRQRPITGKALRAAIFWEHRHLSQQKILSTPSVDEALEVEFFSEKKLFRTGLAKIAKSVVESSATIQMHPIFGPIRDHGVWVTIFFQVQPRRMTYHDNDVYFDRDVTRLAIIDPYEKDRASRRKQLEKRLPTILAEGCINLTTAVISDFVIEDTEHEWSSGHIAYAASREIFRRLRVLLHRRTYDAQTSTEFIWDKFEEIHDVDAYRQSLLGVCAHQTIEKSDYHVRLALEVPSEKSNHKPCDLKHVNLDPENVPDELYTKIHDESRTVSVEIPEETPILPREHELEQQLAAELELNISEPESEEDEDEPAPRPNFAKEANKEPIVHSEPMDIDDPEPQQGTMKGDSSDAGDSTLKRDRSADEPELNEALKRQRLDDEAQTAAPEQNESNDAFLLLDPPRQRSMTPAPCTPSFPDQPSEQPLGDAEYMPSEPLKTEEHE